MSGGEQGDPLMPLLFSIGIQSALEEVARSLEPGEQLCAFLDDICLLCLPSRVQHLHKVLTEALSRHAGSQLHQGKTKTWNHAGIVPENVEILGPDAWQPEGITVLGTPIGSLNTFSARWMSASPRSVSCGWPSRQSQTCSVHCSSWSKVRILAPTTPCARCHRPSQRFTVAPTMLEYGTQQGSSWGTFPATGKRRRNSCPRCRCGWVVWVCGLLNDWHQLRFGPPGTHLP